MRAQWQLYCRWACDDDGFDGWNLRERKPVRVDMTRFGACCRRAAARGGNYSFVARALRLSAAILRRTPARRCPFHESFLRPLLPTWA